MNTRIIIGCPGAGKSTYLAKIAKGLDPKDTLILSYSKPAAASIAQKAGPKYRSSTIHALCFHSLEAIPQQMLRGKQIDSFCEWLGIDPPSSGYDAYDPSIHFLEIYDYARTSGQDVFKAYFKYKENVEFSFTEYVRMVQALLKYKEAHGLYEFHDLLDHFDPVSAPSNLLIDEAQDLSFTLVRALEKLVKCGVKRIWMVGDPMQSIYTYSGADPKYLYHFGGREEFLDQSYRCPAAVVNKAKKLFANAKFKPTDEAGEVVNENRVPEDADMVLTRTNYIRYRVIKKFGISPKKVITMHRAKGLQADHVVIINSKTRRVRISTEIEPESEARVLYTAITRAKKKLTIVDGKNPNKWI